MSSIVMVLSTLQSDLYYPNEQTTVEQCDDEQYNDDQYNGEYNDKEDRAWLGPITLSAAAKEWSEVSTAPPL